MLVYYLCFRLAWGRGKIRNAASTLLLMARAGLTNFSLKLPVELAVAYMECFLSSEMAMENFLVWIALAQQRTNTIGMFQIYTPSKSACQFHKWQVSYR